MSINQKADSLMAVLDTVFVVNGEMIEKNGEDSYAYSVNAEMGMIGVFDGCGGIGSRKYPEYNNKTGAYIASRLAGKVALDWFKRNCTQRLSESNIVGICDDLQVRLRERMASMETGTETGTLRGSLTKSFPTTTSVILFSNYKNSIYSSFIWAGDSRGFILTQDGLTQMTCDDIEGGSDAMSNLSADGKLTNVVTAEGNFKLNNKNVICDNPAIFITATDGCFGYFSTPMEFEFMIIETLQHSENAEQWKNNLDSYIRGYTGDDYTMCIAVYKYKSFEKLKSAYAERSLFLKEYYISKLESADDVVKAALWDEYKKTYYKGV